MNLRTSRTALALLTAVTSMAWGCSSSSNDADIGTSRATLHRAKGCSDLLGDLKADATFKVNHGIDQQIAQIKACIAHNGDANCAYGGYYGGVGGNFGGAEASDQATGAPKDSESPPSASPNSPTSPTAGSDNSGSAGNETTTDPGGSTAHSDTNTQVAGVDEADIVKTDGTNLYVLHGNTFRIVKATPATNMTEASTTTIEGQPTEMFVADGAVVIYSTVAGNAVYTAAGVAPRNGYGDYGNASGGKAEPAIALVGSDSGTVYGGYASLTKITVLTLASGTPTVTRELYFEGGYLDSRRVGTHVRTVLSGGLHGPTLQGVWELFGTGGASTEPGYPGEPNTSPPSPPVDAGAPDTPPAPATDAGPAPATDASVPDLDAGDSDASVMPMAFRGGESNVGTRAWAPGTYPKTGSEMIEALEVVRKTNTSRIQASKLTDWLPYSFVKDGATTTAKNVACEDFYVPTVGSTQSGYTEIAAIDLANPSAAPKETAILGQAATVYGSADTLYLAANAWVDPPVGWVSSNSGVSSGSGGGTAVSEPASPPPSVSDGGAAPSSGQGGSSSGGAPTPAPGESNVRPLVNPTTQGPVTTWSVAKTHVHKFAFTADPTFPSYVASGTVAGTVKDQFALDDKDGKLRIATTESRVYTTADGQWVPSSSAEGDTQRPYAVNRLFVLAPNGGELQTIGDVGELAPNERIYSTRFVGNRGYIVTFRQVDPLFVVDLAKPEKPVLLGELTIPGFSEYMHPLDDNHLLTIGRAATAEGRQQGLQLQIFDVTNGAAPSVAFKFTFEGDQYGSSAAEYDHKAFTYFADKKLLAFPYFAYGQDGMHSSLELFHVDLAAGISKLGSIDASKLLSPNANGYCGGYYGPSVRRGVFIGDFVYAISYGGIIAKNVNDLAGAGGELPFPAPAVDPSFGYGPSCGGVDDPGEPAPMPEPMPTEPADAGAPSEG